MKRLVLTLMILATFAFGGMAQSLNFDFEDGLQGWTVLDADGDGHNWETNTDGMGHFGSDGMVLSYSKDPVTGDSLTPDEYLVSPRIVLNGDWPVISFFACALDEIYPAEHFGVSISTTVNNDPLAFTSLYEWTIVAKDAGNRQGNWYQHTVDLSSYSGQEVYLAIHHFYTSGQSAICIDDIHIEGETVDPHSYEPIVADGKQWNVLFSYPWNPPEPQHKHTDIYKIEGDTLVDGVSYKVMYTTRNENLTGWSVCGVIRETEDKQVLYRRDGASYDEILYDFSMEVGDTIFMYEEHNEYMIVVEKGEILVNEEPRQQIVLEYPFGNGEQEVWIEGIGSLYGIINSGSLFLMGGSTDLLCYYEDGDLIWQNTTPGYNECYIVNSGGGQQNGLMVTPTLLVFDEPAVPQTFTISNQLDFAVTITGILVQPDDNMVLISYADLPQTIQPNESMNVEVELNSLGYKGYNTYHIYVLTSEGTKVVTIRVNEEAWDEGLLPWPMMGVYFTEGEPFTQTFYLYNTNALRTIIIDEISEEGSDYLSMTPSHSLPYILPAGEMLEVTVTLVNFPEYATTANLFVNSSEGEINGPFFYIAGGLSPGNGDLVIAPDTLWFTRYFPDDQVFVMHNETSNAVTITSITNDDEEFIQILYHDGTEYLPIEDVLPIELQPNQSTQVIVRLEPMIIPPAKQRDHIISYVNIATTEGDRTVTLMVNENLVNFGLVVVPYMAELYLNEPSHTFTLINAETSRPITIYSIEEENANYLEITPQYPLPYTLQNYNDYMHCTVSFHGGRSRDWGADTYLIYHTSIGDFRSIVTIEQGLLGFPLSPEWYYEIENENGSITYQYLYQAGDTIVQDEPTHILVRINTLYDKDLHEEMTHEYVYERDGKIYWWNKTLEEFTVLYDFGAVEGDEWEIKVGNESLVMHVDWTENIEYEGRACRLLHVSDAENLFSGDIVSGIGHLTSFFPERLMDNGDGIRVEGLRCYWIDDELVFKLGNEDCDAIYSEVHGLEEDGPSTPSTGSGTLTVYPNPTNGVLFVRTHAERPYEEYRITNIMGQTLLQGRITDEMQQIDVTGLAEGMYFISVGEETRKFVVR